MPDSDEREAQILNAAATIIVRLGYDKTTMNDIADEAGVSRATVYLYFKGKEELFEALVYREWMQYAQVWLESIEADPRGGTIGGFYRAVFRAINSRPLIASIMRRDRRVIGNYLRKSNNLFAWMESGSTTVDFIRLLQGVGAVRQDLDPVVTGHLIDMMSYGYLTIEDFRPADASPPYEAVLEGFADMMERLLAPEDGGNSEAGKVAFRQIAAAGRAQMEQVKQAKEKQ